MADSVALDTNALEQMLVDGKFDDAKKLLNGYLSADLPKEVKGAAYVAFVMTYMSVMNRIYENYQQALDETLTGIQMLNKKEKEVSEKIDLARVKNEIKNISK